MEDDFESQFADELDALNDYEEPGSPKPKRSLNFNTPKEKSNKQVLNTRNELTPARSPLTNLPNVLNGRGSGQKRSREEVEDTGADSDLEYDDEDLNDAAPASKRGRYEEQVDEAVLWGDEPEPPAKVKAKGLRGSKVNSWNMPDDVVEEAPCADMLTIDRILEERRKLIAPELQINREASRNDMLFNDEDFLRQRVYKRIPGTSYLPTTGTCGNRVYMHMKEDGEEEKEFAAFSISCHGSSLLGVPISVLRLQIAEEKSAQFQSQCELARRELTNDLEEDLGFQDVDDEDKEIQTKTLPRPSTGPEKQLWVEKYSPQAYTDLLSEESINRTLLHWLKMWDFVVFDKEMPVKDKKKKDEPKNQKYKKKNQPEVLEELDKYKRPLQKVALLCGPPGLGKTTLAHIIAKHAGYNVVEMNASDDRSAEMFTNKIEAATQMKAVMGADPRPNCLIIDEIDGAPQAAINVLLNLIKKVDPLETQTKKKKKEEGTILRRPIICICNDQYVPALRGLRQNAMILNFPQTEPSKLASRLYEVSRFENLRSDMNALLALCEKTDNDIRSCLNTLQFIQRQCKELTLQSIQTMTVGQKDMHKSLFSVWYEVLTLPKPKRNKFVNTKESNTKDVVLNTSPSARFKNILSLVQGAGENDKLMQGLFENYLECKFKDPYMDGVSTATDWLCYSDLLTEYIQHVQDYRLMPYLPYTPVLFHLLFASSVPPKIQYPHSMAELHIKITKCENLIGSMTADMVPRIRKYINTPVVVMEILPLLMEIIQPTFRPINTQLYSKKEKEDLAQLIGIMISYNLTYQQEKSFEGQYTYVLEPHMDEVCKFPGMKQHRQLSYASKQLVAREIELEKMRRSEVSRAAVSGPPEPAGALDASGPSKIGTNPGSTPAVPSHLQKLTAKPLGKELEETQVKDFFGRVLKRTTPESKSTKSVTKDNKMDLLATDIWFHFQEGYSNAVRRNMKVKDFF